MIETAFIFPFERLRLERSIIGIRAFDGGYLFSLSLSMSTPTILLGPDSVRGMLALPKTRSEIISVALLIYAEDIRSWTPTASFYHLVFTTFVVERSDVESQR